MGRTYTERVEPSRATGPLNLNPPHFHLLLWPLTAFAPTTAFTIWMALSAVALLASLMLVSTSLRLGGWAIASLLAVSYASPAMFATVLTGQVGAMLLLPFTLAWMGVRRRQPSAIRGVARALREHQAAIPAVRSGLPRASDSGVRR